MGEIFMEKYHFSQVDVKGLGLADVVWQRFENLLVLKDSVLSFCAVGQPVVFSQWRTELEGPKHLEELESSQVIARLI